MKVEHSVLTTINEDVMLCYVMLCRVDLAVVMVMAEMIETLTDIGGPAAMIVRDTLTRRQR